MIENHTIGNPAGLFAPVLARHLDGRPGRPADMGPQVDGRVQLRSADSVQSQTTDRTGMYQLSRAASADASASWPPEAGPDQRVPIDSVPRCKLR
jgi:hypothetical protein